jgi:hypothetical protein
MSLFMTAERKQEQEGNIVWNLVHELCERWEEERKRERKRERERWSKCLSELEREPKPRRQKWVGQLDKQLKLPVGLDRWVRALAMHGTCSWLTAK